MHFYENNVLGIGVENALNLTRILFFLLLLKFAGAPMKNLLQSMTDKSLVSVDIKIPVQHCHQ